MTKSDALKHFGSQAAIARAVGISQPSVFEWTEDDIPALRQIQLERASGGVLKADPSCYGPAAEPQQAAAAA